MTTELDDVFGELALELVAQFGKSITYKSVAPGTVDDDDNTTAEVVTTTTVKALLDSYDSVKTMLSAQYSPGTVIQVGDVRVWLPGRAVSAAPVPSDQFVIDGETWKVESVNKKWSGDEVALYDIQVRR